MPVLQPPRYEDPEKNEQAAIAWFTALLGLVVLGLQGVVYTLVPTMGSSGPYLVPEIFGLLLVLAGLKRGFVVLPGLVFITGLVGLVTAFVFYGGGLDYAFPPLLGTAAVMGALMLGWRAGVAVTAWGVAVTGAVFAVGSTEDLLIPGQDRTSILFTIQAITVLVTGSLVTYSVYRLSLALRSEREQADRAERNAARLEAARRFTADVVQSMAESVLIADSDGRIFDANDAAVSLFAVATKEALVGRKLAEVVDAADLAALEATATPGTRAFGETTVRTHGLEKPVRIARSPVRSEEGAALHVFVLSDVSQQVEAKRRSEQAARAADEANRAKSQFLANMSHELRTPLNAVIGYSDMLLDDVDDPEIREDVERIRVAGSHLLSLINDVLDMSKIEAGRLDVALEPVFVREVLDEVRDAVHPVAERRGNEVHIQLETDLAAIQTDGRKFRQILLNLASNAVKFTENGSVTIRVSADEENLRVDVTDTGIGIRAETVARLFRPFVQADDSTSRRYGGTGLGLALSRRFADMLGGSLTVVSEPGEGSTFTLVHPIGQVAPTTPAPEVDQGQAPLVLCVDDDANTLDLLGRVLRRQGLRVAQAGTARQALEVARQHRPAVITLDVMMPEMDGWTMLQRLRADPVLRDVPVVMLSMVDHSQASALSLGASDYLVKPVDPDTLTRTLRRYLGKGSGRVLVVDDEENMRELLRRLLTGEGWEVSLAWNSRVALDMLPDVKPDLVVLDLMMPEMDGFAFVEHVREDARFRDVPIVVLTAAELDREQWEMLAANTSHIVQKSGHGLQRVLQVVRRFAGR